MTRKRVVSSNIRAIGYDPIERILEVEFVNSGVYRYRNVAVTDHVMLVTSKSIGRHFGQHIKGKFEFERIPSEVVS